MTQPAPLTADEVVDTLLREIAAAPPASRPVDFTGTDRYRVLRPLGQGTFGVVHEVFDRETGSTLALKALRFQKPEWVVRFKREFRALADVSHLNIVRLHELSQEQSNWFFTMELVRGVPLLHWIREDPTRLEGTFEQLMTGVEALHAAGFVHCDLKPSNVLVTAEGRVVLLDFGLAGRADSADLSVWTEGGTPLYMAPEQVLRGRVGFPADWYAVGVMLYEALTGRPPFRGTTPDVLKAKLEQPIPALRDLAPGAQPHLERLCESLLQREPAARPAGLLQTEAFVGRTAELEMLQRHFERASGGLPAVAVLSGPSGVGKSTLVSEFIRRWRRQTPSLLTLSGRCFEQELVPFNALDGLIDELGRHLLRLPEVDGAQVVGPDAGALGVLFPSLTRLQLISAAPLAADERLAFRRRAFDALRLLFVRLAVRQPLLLVIDDLQWADLDSITLLQELLHDCPLWLVVLHRQEDPGECLTSFLRVMRELATTNRVQLCEIGLGALSSSEAYEAALASLTEPDRARAEAIARESQGMPFLIRPLSRMAPRQSPSSGEELLELTLVSQMDSLPPPARQLLEVLSIAGRPLAREVAGKSARMEADQSLAVAVLRAERLIRSSGGRLEPYHHAIRTIVARRLPARRAQTLHLGLAENLAPTGAEDALLAFHFHQGGASALASRHAEQAGDAAASTLAFDVAARHFDQALRWDTSSPGRRQALSLRRAHALANAGHASEAGELFLTLATQTTGPQLLEHRRQGVEHLLVGGIVERGLGELRKLSADVQLHFPRDANRALLRTAGILFWLWLGHILELPRRRALDAGSRARADVAASAFRGLVTMAPGQAGYFAVAELQLAMAAGERRRTSLALARVGSGLFGPGPAWLAKIGERLVTNARLMNTELEDDSLTGALDIAQGANSFWDGSWEAALVQLERGASLLRADSGPTTHERNIARLMSIRSLEELGRWHDARARNEEMLRDAIVRGDRYAEVTAGLNRGFCALADGEPARARQHVADALAKWPLGLESLQHVYGLRLRLYCDLWEGRALEGWHELRAAWTALGRGMHLTARPGRVDLFLLRGRLAAACGDTADVRRCASELQAVGRLDAGAHAALLRATVAALEGDVSSALRALQLAERKYLGLSMNAYAEVVGLRRAHLEGEDGVVQLQALRALGCLAPERWAALYAPGFGSSLAQQAR